VIRVISTVSSFIIIFADSHDLMNNNNEGSSSPDMKETISIYLARNSMIFDAKRIPAAM